MSTHRLLTVLLLLFLFCHAANAAVVAAQSGASITIDGKEIDMERGDYYYSVNSRNLRSSILQITSIGPGDRASAKLIKGQPAIGERLIKRPAPKGKEARKLREKESTPRLTDKWLRLGVGASMFNQRGADTNHVIGFAVTALGEFHYLDLLFESGLEYFQAGSIASYPGTTLTLTISEIGIPLLYKYPVLDDPNLSLRLKGGLMTSYALSGSYRITRDSGSYDGNAPLSDRLDFFAVGGVEYLSKFQSGGGFWVDVVYNFGLKQFNAASSGSTSTLANQGWLFTIGLMF